MKKKRLKLSDILLKSSTFEEDPENEEKRMESNLEEIEERIKQLSKNIGRKLTDDEENDILDIVDEYTPKKENGKYLVELLPFEYAWLIYDAKKDIENEKFLENLEIGE